MKLAPDATTLLKAKAQRRTMSLPEVLLWQQLRQRPAGIKFRRQHPAGRYVLDFYADAARLAIEVDGEAHGRGDRPARDAIRDAWFAGQGITTSRIPAADILPDLDAVMRHIIDVARAATPSTGFGGPPSPVGED